MYSALRGQKWVSDPPGVGVTDSCEPTSMGAGQQSLVLCRSGLWSLLPSDSPAPECVLSLMFRKQQIRIRVLSVF